MMNSFILEAIWERGVRQELGEFKTLAELNVYLETCKYNGEGVEYEVFEKTLVIGKFTKDKKQDGTI